MRRGHNEGTIRKRSVRDKTGAIVDERWEAIVSLPGGKRKSLYGSSRAEVVAKLRKAQEGLLSGVMPASDRLAVRTYLEHWLAGIKLSVAYSTGKSYANYVRILTSYLGTRPLAKLDVEEIRQMYTSLIEEGYAPSTMQTLHGVLHHALKDAMARGLIGRNVATLIRSPKGNPVEIHPLTREQARLLIATSQSHRLHAIWVLAIATGMRLGEMLALEWSDIDFTRNHLTVNRSLYRREGIGMLTKVPKTKRGQRKVRLDSQVLAELKAHRGRQNQERLLAGSLWQDNNLVFCNEVGGYCYFSTTLRVFKRLLKACELPDIRIHDLRHTAATLMLGNGVNIKSVSEMLGHSNVAITLAIYAHVTEDMQEHAAQVMGQLLFN